MELVLLFCSSFFLLLLLLCCVFSRGLSCFRWHFFSIHPFGRLVVVVEYGRHLEEGASYGFDTPNLFTYFWSLLAIIFNKTHDYFFIIIKETFFIFLFITYIFFSRFSFDLCGSYCLRKEVVDCYEKCAPFVGIVCVFVNLVDNLISLKVLCVLFSVVVAIFDNYCFSSWH